MSNGNHIFHSGRGFEGLETAPGTVGAHSGHNHAFCSPGDVRLKSALLDPVYYMLKFSLSRVQCHIDHHCDTPLNRKFYFNCRMAASPILRNSWIMARNTVTTLSGPRGPWFSGRFGPAPPAHAGRHKRAGRKIS